MQKVAEKRKASLMAVACTSDERPDRMGINDVAKSNVLEQAVPQFGRRSVGSGGWLGRSPHFPPWGRRLGGTSGHQATR